MHIVKYIYNSGIHAHLSKCGRGTWSEKGWESLHYRDLMQRTHLTT